jgi:hypothetical protein
MVIVHAVAGIEVHRPRAVVELTVGDDGLLAHNDTREGFARLTPVAPRVGNRDAAGLK